MALVDNMYKRLTQAAATSENEMTLNGFLQLAVYLLLLLSITKPLGVYMTRVFSGETTFMGPVLGPVERLIYRAVPRRCGERTTLDRLTPPQC